MKRPQLSEQQAKRLRSYELRTLRAVEIWINTVRNYRDATGRVTDESAVARAEAGLEITAARLKDMKAKIFREAALMRHHTKKA